MYCRYCGKIIDDSANFCGYCGAKTAKSPDPDSDRTSQKDGRLAGGDPPESLGNSGKMIIAAVITIAVFIAAALIGAHFIFPESNGNHSTEISSGKENTSAGKSGKSEEGSVASEERSAESEEGPVADKASGNEEDYVRRVREKFENIPEEEIAPFTEEEIRIFEDAVEYISKNTENLIDEEGHIDPEDCDNYLDAVEECAAELQRSGEVAGYERNDTAISILFESGISYYIAAPIKGMLNSGDGDTRVLALETFSGADYSVFDPDRNISDKNLKKIARKLDEAGSKFSFNEDNDYKEVENVSIQYLKKTGSFKILLWHGHGGYLWKNGTFLMTNQNYDKNDPSLDTDMKLGRVILAKQDKPFAKQKYAITSKFVDKYFPQIDDAIIYLGACNSCKYADLAESLLRRGARCVIGYSKEVAGTYEMNCRAQLFERLRNGESIPDAVENTRKDQSTEPLNFLAGGQLMARYADDITPSDQYLETGNKKAGGKIKSDQPSPIPDPKSLAAGDTVVFGNYYYDYKYPKDKMPIEWVVLDVRDGRALIISKYALMNYPYLDHSGTCTWETSSVRDWLNNDFYKEAFTEEERKVIGLTGLTNADNPKYGTDGGNNTTDYVFVLSADEAGTYFSSDKERQAKGTTWAYNNGLALISPETGDYSSVVFNGAYGYIADYNCMYWLRTPGADNGAAAFVDEKGTVQPGGSYAYYYPNADPKVASPLPELGVRPVLWLNADTAETDASNASEYEISAEERAIAEAYREVVKNYSNGEADTPQYDFGFIDNDNIPELLIAGGNSDAAGVEIYTCKDGAAQRTGVFGQDGNMRYLPYEDTIFTHQADMGCSLNTWYHLDGSIIHTLRNTIEGQEPDPVNEVDDTAVSKEEYESLADQIHTAYPYEQMTMCGKDTNMYDFSDNTGFSELERYLADKARLKAALEKETGMESYEFICADYDKDGKQEAFAVTGKPNDYEDEYVFYDNARIWFVSADGVVTEMTSPEEGQRFRMINTETALFYVFERHAYGSSSVSYIYGVRNGKPYEPAFSGNCEMFRRADLYDRTEEEPVVTEPFVYTTSVFPEGRGHVYLNYFCKFNSSNGEFEN